MDDKERVVPDYQFSFRGEIAPHHRNLLDPIIDECKRLNARRVLDLGCGDGVLTRSLADAGFEVVGCDISRAGLAIARQMRPDLNFLEISVYDNPSMLRDHNFDIVVSMEVIEHLESPSALPRFAGEVLPDNGHLIISTPYHGYLKNLLIAVSGKWDAHHTTLWEGGHIKFFSR